ncbi:hypothetical protein Dimus_024717 [Dionaea muscipula]
MEMVGALSSPVPALKEQAITLSSPMASLVFVKETTADHVADGDSKELLLGGDVDAGVGLLIPPVSVSSDYSSLNATAGRVAPLNPLSGVDTASSVGEGGLVREEGRAAQVAKEVLRPQPADGLRQLP